MIFNKKDTVQKNWRMVKKGKGIAFSCMLFFTAGAVVVNPVATVFNQNGVAYAQTSIRSSVGAENLDYSNKTNPSDYVQMSYVVDKANNVIHWTVLDNPGRKANAASGHVYFTIPKDVVGQPTNWKVVQTDKNGKVVNTRNYWKDNDGSYLMGQNGRMDTYFGSDMTKKLKEYYDKTKNPAVKGHEAELAAQTSNRSQALYTLSADNNGFRNVAWTITFDTPILDTSKPLDYVAGMQGTGLIGGATNIMTGFSDNFIDESANKFQAVAVQEKYTQKLGGNFNADPAQYVTNKAGTPEFPNNYRGATTFAWKDGQAPTATTPGTYTKTVVVTYPEHYNQTPQEVTITFEVKGNEASEIQEPAKTPVQNLTNLTEDEKDKVKKAIEAANPGKVANVVVGNDGTATVTFNDGSEATLTPEKTVEKATKDADGVKVPDVTRVVNPNNLTEDEKAKVIEEVKKANPKADKVEVGNDGTATVTFKDGSVATLTPDKTVKKVDDTSKAADEIKEPTKTPVGNPYKLTDEEKAKVIEEVKKANPKAKDVEVSDNGATTVTFNDGSVGKLTQEQTIKEPDARNIQNPAVTAVQNPSNLTQPEKDKVKKAIEEANPGKVANVVVGNDGTATVTFKDGSKATLTPDKTVKKATKDADGIVNPVKTPVENPSNLTEDEKDKVKKAIEEANPGKVANVVVGNDGTATVTFNDGSEATLTPEKTVEKATKDADGIVNPVKTPVENPSNLTEAEKGKVKKAIEEANPGKVANVEVTPDGTATVTFKDGTVATLTPDKTVKKADSDPVKPEVPGTINIPGNKVSVDNTGSLTPEEIAKVKEEVGKVNPGKTVVVDAKGNATVTDPKTNLVLVIPAEELVKPKEQPKPTPTPTPVTPSDKFEVTVPTVKVPVVDAKNLTPAEQAAVKTKVEESNPGKTVVVDAKGNATVTDPNDPTATPAIIPGDNLVVETEKAEEAKPATPVVVNVPGNKVPVDNTGSLTPEEIAKVKEEVGKVNPGKTVVVDAKGNATVTDPTTGKVVVVPGASLVEQKVTPTPTPTPKQSDSIVVPSLTIVMDPTNLTQSEKVKVENEVKKSNPTATKVEVGNDGTTVVTFKDGSTATLTPSQTIQKTVVETKDSDKVKYPSVATPVADVTNLTGDEKAKVEEEVKKSNPTATKVEVGDDGTTTVTFPDGSTAVIPGAATVVTKDNGGGYVPTPENPSVVVPSEKTLVKDPSNLTEEEKAAVKEKVEKANPGKVVSVDEKGNVTVTDPQSGKTVTISADKLVVKQGNGVSLDKAVSEIKGRLASTGLNSTEGASLGFAALLAGLVLAARKRKENK